MNLTFRIAEPSDSNMILDFIKELAEYEKLLDTVVATEASLRESLFGEKRYAHVIFAMADGKEVGFALYFFNFSTFLGRPGLYIEDIYVKPSHRGSGIGKALMVELGKVAVKENCGRMEWWVLNWNPARKFYEKLGAEAMSEWVTYRLSKENVRSMTVDA